MKTIITASMDYYVYHAEQQIGPVSPEHVAECLAEGRFSPSDPAWHEGLTDWVPLSALFSRERPSLPPPIAETHAPTFDVPADVLHAIRALAQRDHPGDFSTQRYVIQTQGESYLALQQLSAPDVPHDVLSGICATAAADHSNDYSTQKYVIQTQLEAYRELYAP